MANGLNATEPEELVRPISSTIVDAQSDQSTRPPTGPLTGQIQPTRPQHLARVVGVPVVLVLLLAGAVLSLWLLRSASDGSNGSSSDSAADNGKSLAVTNPGFEEGLRGWVDGFARWYAKPNSFYKVVVDTATAHQGQASAYIMPTTADMSPAESGAISYKMAADELRGKKVRYSAYVKADDIEAAGLWMEVHGTMHVPGVVGRVRTNSQFPLRADNALRIEGTADWGKYEVVVDVPEEAEFIVFGLDVWSRQGRVWLDDVQLEIVGDEVALTCRGNADMDMMGNSDFEHEDDSWRTLGGWPEFYTYHAGKSREAAYEGEQGAYLRVDKPSPKPELFALFGNPVYVLSCLKGRKVTVSVYTNADAVDGRAVLWAKVQYALIEDGDDPERDGQSYSKGAYLNEEITIWPPADAKGDAKKGWQRQELTFDLPHTAADLQIGIRLYGEGEIWIDNVRVDAR